MCAGAQRSFQHKPSALSWYQSVARVAVSLMLHNIRLKKMKQRQFLSFYWPDAKKRLRPLNFFFLLCCKRKQSPRSALFTASADVIKATFRKLSVSDVGLFGARCQPLPRLPQLFFFFSPNLYFIMVAPVKRGRNKSLFVIKPLRLACCLVPGGQIVPKKKKADLCRPCGNSRL